MAVNFYTDINADSFVKEGGTSAQYLMADGSVSTGSGGSSPWSTDTNGITYSAGNVGIGGASVSGFDLRVVGQSRFNDDIRCDGDVSVAGGDLIVGNSLKDTNSVAGTAGQILSSEGAGGGVEWIDAGVTSDTSEGGSGSVAIGNMVKISQSDYTSLATKDADTLYFIVD